jgi:hypothetical protein
MNDSLEHLDDDAELYPLGVLDDDAARRVERHIAGCKTCAERVADAQLMAATLASTLPPAAPSPALAQRLSASARGTIRSPRRQGWDLRALALAAALALALAGLGRQTVVMQQHDTSDALALATIAHSHFLHTPMAATLPQPFAAKVLYARDGSWLYLIADGAPGPLRAVARTAHGSLELGSLEGPAQAKSLLAHPSEKVLALELRTESGAVASVTLAY